MQLEPALLAFCSCSLRASVVDFGSRRGRVYKVAFGTDPHAVIVRLMRQIKVERERMNICFETNDTRVWFWRYLGSTAMVITTEIRPDKTRDGFCSLSKLEFTMTKSIFIA